MRSALVVGADSLIGAAMLASLRERKWQVSGTSRRTTGEDTSLIFLDLEQRDTFSNLPRNVDVLLFCAGVTDRRVCRDQLDWARSINVDATKELLDAYMSSGTNIVFLSTNLVLDGLTPAASSYAEPSPVDPYGEQKLEVERFLADCRQHTICRLGKVLHPNVPLIAQWMSSLRKQQAISAFDDYFMSPVHLSFVVETLLAIMTQGPRGIVQATANVTVSYFEFAKILSREMKIDETLVRRDTARSKGVDVEMEPKFAHLDGSAVEKLGLCLPTPQDTARLLASFKAADG